MSRLDIDVYGKPAPQGSKNVNRYGATYEQSKALPSWREAVKTAARQAAERNGWVQLQRGTPVQLSIDFLHARPASHYGTGRNAGTLKPSASTWKSTAPDLSKLIRATEDALTDAGIWADDCIVAAVYAADCWDTRSGAYITIETLDWSEA